MKYFFFRMGSIFSNLCPCWKPRDDKLKVRVRTKLGCSEIVVTWCESTNRDRRHGNRHRYTIRIQELRTGRVFFLKPQKADDKLEIGGLVPGEKYRIAFRNRDQDGWGRFRHGVDVKLCSLLQQKRPKWPWCVGLDVDENDSSDEENHVDSNVGQSTRRNLDNGRVDARNNDVTDDDNGSSNDGNGSNEGRPDANVPGASKNNPRSYTGNQDSEVTNEGMPLLTRRAGANRPATYL